jgi:hypothetical protein
MYRSLSVVCFTFGLLLFGFCETGNAQILCGKLRGLLRGSNCCPQSCNPCPTQVCPSCVDPCCQRMQIMRLPTTKEEACADCCSLFWSNTSSDEYKNCIAACTSIFGTSSTTYCKCFQTLSGEWKCNAHNISTCYCRPPTRRFRLFGR